MSNEAAEGSLAEVAYRGEWRIEPGKSPETVNLSLSYPASASNSSGSITCSDLDLTIASLAGKPSPVHFALRREAGTFECRGTVGEGRGRGAFRFRPDLAYERALAESGLPPLTHRARVQAGLFDVRSSYVATIAEIMLPSVTFDRMLKAKMFRIAPEHVRALANDFPEAEVDDLITAAMVGVTPDYVEALRRADVPGLRIENVSALRASGVDQGFIERLAAGGRRGLSIDEVFGLHAADSYYG
jgi:hypothetical protein